MSDYDHSDALRFRSEADYWQKQAQKAEAKVAELEADNARLREQWESVPWEALEDPSEAHNRLDIELWAEAHAPKPAASDGAETMTETEPLHD